MASRAVPLTIDEPTGVRRENWPVRWGVPFPKGAMREACWVRLLGPDGREMSCEARETARWPDGSVKWIVLDFQVTLEAQESVSCRLECGEDVVRGKVESPLRVVDRDGEIRVDTGPLTFGVRKSRFDMLEDVELNGNSMFGKDGQWLWILDGDGGTYSLADGMVREVEVEESTHRRIVIRARGRHGTGGGGALFDYVVRITAFTGLPWVQIEYTFLNTEDAETMEIREITFGTQVDLPEERVGLCGSGHKLFESREPFYLYHQELLENYGVFSGSPIYYESGERVDGVGLYEQQLARGWLDVNDGLHGMCVSMRDYLFLYPKEATWKDDRITFSLWPGRAGPIRLQQGVARTFTFMVHCHEGSCTEARAHELAAAFEESLLPRNGPWYLESGAFRARVFREARLIPQPGS